MSESGLRFWPLALITTAGVSVPAFAGAGVVGAANFIAPSGDWLQATLVVCVTGPILAFAEELGRRGYPQPRLAFLVPTVGDARRWRRLDRLALPHILLTPYYHAEGERPLALALLSATVIAFSFVFATCGCSRTVCGPAVLAHFVHNATFAILATYAITTDRPVLVDEYLAGDTGQRRPRRRTDDLENLASLRAVPSVGVGGGVGGAVGLDDDDGEGMRDDVVDFPGRRHPLTLCDEQFEPVPSLLELDDGEQHTDEDRIQQQRVVTTPAIDGDGQGIRSLHRTPLDWLGGR